MTFFADENLSLPTHYYYYYIQSKLSRFDLFHDVSLFYFFLRWIADQPKDGNYDDGKLIIVTDSQILAIPLHRCNSEKINSCR